MGRKKVFGEADLGKISLQIPKEIVQSLQERAAVERRSLNYYIYRILRDFCQENPFNFVLLDGHEDEIEAIGISDFQTENLEGQEAALGEASDLISDAPMLVRTHDRLIEGEEKWVKQNDGNN